ncbi:hypothetical protein EZMO1_0772 [Endozoicomonas montiporae CL-33]|uniref:Uncharacterized protein n=1 Tax=Endozoicomonas montiporae CL-33 TaxID=570277 RepID=A0A142B8C2_9GAMM|nr:hypothetical protein EZMO1_0772 [Endozoicomonas montiporae CL-33]
MRRIYLFIGFFFFCLALFFAAYGYYLLIRAPGSDISAIEFIEKVISKIIRLMIK